MLPPVATTQILQPLSSAQQTQVPDNQTSFNSNKQPVGATWSNSGNLNIDLDNLLGNKQDKNSGAPSMNQLASNPTSPTHRPRTMPQNSIMSPGFGQQLNFNNQPLSTANQQFFAAFK